MTLNYSLELVAGVQNIFVINLLELHLLLFHTQDVSKDYFQISQMFQVLTIL